MRSSFFSRPPLRLIWKTENFMGIRGPGPRSLRLDAETRGALHGFLRVRHHVVELQAHLLAHRQLGIAPLAFAAQLLLQGEDGLRARERIERHAPLYNFDEAVGVDAA